MTAEALSTRGDASTRRVGPLLAVGIALVPFAFAWLLLRRGYSMTARVISFGWLALVVLIAIASDRSGGEAEHSTAASAKAEKTIASYREKIERDAVSDVTRAAYPKLYASLGAEKFALSNDLDDWAALHVAMSPKCDRVEIVSVSEQSTRSELSWFADCANKERFYVSEAEATAAKASLSALDVSTPVPASASVAEPASAKFAEFNEVLAVSACDEVAKAGLVSPGSYKPEWDWGVTKHATTGQVTITRQYRARNAFNAELRSSWSCTVEPRTNRVIALK